MKTETGICRKKGNNECAKRKSRQYNLIALEKVGFIIRRMLSFRLVHNLETAA
jgi:hypothetical protein